MTHQNHATKIPSTLFPVRGLLLAAALSLGLSVACDAPQPAPAAPVAEDGRAPAPADPAAPAGKPVAQADPAPAPAAGGQAADAPEAGGGDPQPRPAVGTIQARPADGGTSPGKGGAAKAPITSKKGASGQARADGEKCSKAADCESGVCEGEGCGAEVGKCVAKSRVCTRDLRAYCGCDGSTFRASGSCPGRLFKKRGEC